MFKSARWRGEKNKVKCVFKLQFHAAQLEQLDGDGLMISLTPADVGKPTSRLEKCKVRDGSCYWEKPIYETVKLSQDPKTGKFLEKIYHFVVAKDSSRFGNVGEFSIDFASYAEAAKLSSLSLPLRNANSSAVLNVSIQRLQDSFCQSDIEGSENASHNDRSLRRQFTNGDLEGSTRDHTTDEHGTENGIYKNRRASTGSNVMLTSSDSSSGLDTPQKHETKNKLTRESSIAKDRSLQWDWLNGSDPKLSTDDSSTSTLGETSEESSTDSVIQDLKAKVATLTRQADVSELELQTLRKQIVKEMKKSQDLSKELATLKEEVKGYQNRDEVKVSGMLLIDEGDPWALLQELRQELNYEKEVSSNLRLQLQKTQEPISKSICSENRQFETDDDEEQRELEAIVREHRGVKETYLLEQKVTDLYNEIELYKRDKDDLEIQMEQIALDYEILKQENHDISYKLERSQLQEQLKMQYECSTSYATVNELETQIENLENDLKSKSEELSKSNLAIKELESHIKNLEEELEDQARVFETDLEELIRAKTEQEKRAICAEESLRKMRWQNANKATRLQEELRRVSSKMASTFEVNEKAAMKSVDEANKLRIEKRVLEDTLVKVKTALQHLGNSFQEKLVFIENQITLKSKHLEKIKKQVENMTELQNLESQRLKELPSDSSENFFLLKEKDLQLEIEELERKLDGLVQTSKNSTPTMISDDAILPEMNKTEEHDDINIISKRNMSMELELKELQQKYSEISIKFAEVEGERQTLEMTLRNLNKY